MTRKHLLFPLGLLVFAFSLSAQPDIDRQVEELLAKMTLEEKAGQMMQLTADMLFDGAPYVLTNPRRIDPAKVEKVIKEYKVGSILNVPTGKVPNVTEWHDLISMIQQKAAETRLKIPILYGTDDIHGVNYCSDATLFPQPLAMASTWNPGLAEKVGAITAYEAKAASLTWNFSPALDVGRNPVWSRLWESFGEDVYMNKVMGVATVKGYQGDNFGAADKVLACLKHYAGYGWPVSGKDRTPAYIPEVQLRELFLPAYQATIDAGAMSLMVNSGEISGVPVHASKFMLTDVLRGELGFKGFVVSDWEDIILLHTRHKVASSVKEAVRIAIEAGIDMSMVPVTFEFRDYVVELVNEGQLSMERIDESVRRILNVKMLGGLFQKTVFDPNDYPLFGSDAHRAVSKQAALESVILLKNENEVLPLSKSSRVLVTGPTANTMRSLNGGWSYNWQGTEADNYQKDKNTILEAIRAKLGEDQVKYVPGSGYDEIIDIEAAVQATENVDGIILCLGELSYTEVEGNISDLNLPAAQHELAAALARTGKPIILVLAEGRPRLIRETAPYASGILATFYPGPEGGDALADVLFGDYNPDGKLALTYPKYPHSLTTYDHKHTEALSFGSGPVFDPQFTFGSGLSYTTYL
ncbi:MAG: glycoside hydrolase family 3 N-terminal domain-containing protein [Saprospiraceae bacterium]